MPEKAKYKNSWQALRYVLSDKDNIPLNKGQEENLTLHDILLMHTCKHNSMAQFSASKWGLIILYLWKEVRIIPYWENPILTIHLIKVVL